MATTIMISTNVKPSLLDFFSFILLFTFIKRSEHGNRRLIYDYVLVVLKLPVADRYPSIAADMPDDSVPISAFRNSRLTRIR